MNINRILNKYGFSENEVSVYTCLLKFTEISAFRIADYTKLPRTSVYHILNSLINQGLISSWKKNNVKYFTAESPNRLIKIIEEKKELIKSILPDMLNMRDLGDNAPTARLYTGVEGIKIVWDDILDTLEKKNIKELYAVTHSKMFTHLPKYFPLWIKRREKLAIFTYAITTNIEENKNPSMITNKFRETRLLPSDSPIRGTIDIYANKIAFFSTKDNEVYSIIIESNTISEVLKQFFMSTWQLLGEKSRY
jgi:sugar-specific transcriptional regulator TrmB